MIHIMKPLDVYAEGKKNTKPNLAHFWTQIEKTSHCNLKEGVHITDQNGLKSLQKI